MKRTGTPGHTREHAWTVCLSLIGLSMPLAMCIIAAVVSKQRVSPSASSENVNVQHQMDVLIEHIEFVSGWSLGAIGALSVIGLKLLELGRWTAQVRHTMFTGIGLLVASLYAGHESRLALLNAYLGAAFVDYTSPFHETMTDIQALCLLAGCLAIPLILAMQPFNRASPSAAHGK